jgi:hypothetical protein
MNLNRQTRKNHQQLHKSLPVEIKNQIFITSIAVQKTFYDLTSFSSLAQLHCSNELH